MRRVVDLEGRGVAKVTPNAGKFPSLMSALAIARQAPSLRPRFVIARHHRRLCALDKKAACAVENAMLTGSGHPKVGKSNGLEQGVVALC
jgi:hypothetical protein